MSRIRTFIAIDPDQAVRDRIVALQKTLARAGTKVSWTQPENIHLTLLFLGEVEDKDLPAVCEAVANAVADPPSFTMSVETAGCFPNPRRPRILWVGVGQGAEQVTRVHDAIERPLLDLRCYRREDRRFTPHLTMGRVRAEGPARELVAALAKQATWKGGECTVREVLVMGSQLEPGGPRYTVLSRAKLRNE